MKKFFCLGTILVAVLLSGCQIPVDKIISNNPEEEKLNTTTAQPKKTDDINSIKETQKNETTKEPVTTGITDDMVEVTVYYKDKEGMLVPITRTIKKEEGIAKAVLRSMVDAEINRKQAKAYGLIPVLPENTEIKGISIKEEIATVDFNEHVLNYADKKSEQNIVAAIVYALTEFKTINGVKILINGKEHTSLKYGTDLSAALSRNNLLINTEKINLEDKIKKVDVYLFKHINEALEYILPVSVEYIGVEEKDL
ncbi:MAG: GerMN domain-containing protein, partial [Clostridiaceae bacterium]|nr:GerMN domain-containing protein [Clostridiaceae bacterium]